jgi:drug/metabolite transporter (DMT)-like permease
MCEASAIWLLFFGTTVYGHVALKIAVDRAGTGPGHHTLGALASPWGWSACLAWAASCLLWALTLAHHRLAFANSLSALRYVLIALAAWAVLGERLCLSHVAGMILIGLGVLLVR